MKNLFIFCLFLISFQAGAQFKFLANNNSEQYKAKIFVADCADGLCGGKATIILYDKISNKELETFHSVDLDFSLNGNQDAKIGWLDLGKYQSPLIFGDFNFDGIEDLAIRNGSKGLYMSPSYDIYLATNNKFFLSKELTKLASENLGMFGIDKKNKLLSVEQKNGCCYQQTISYRIDKKNLVTEVSSVIEDSSIGDDVTVITTKVVNGKKQRTVQKYKIKDYYSEN